MMAAEFNFLGWSLAVGAFEFVWRSALIVFVCLLLDRVLRKHSAEMRDVLWRAMLFALVAFPLLSPIVPPLLHARAPEAISIDSPVPVGVTSRRGNTVTIRAAQVRNQQPVLWGALPFAVYAIFATALLGRFTYAMRRLRLVAERSELCTDERLREIVHQTWLESGAQLRPSVRLTNETRVPVALECDTEISILLPESAISWPEAKLGLVLAHEMCHVRRNDPALAQFASLACCLLWFHPLVWFVKRRLASLAEECCDEFVLERTRAANSYAGVLLEFAEEIAEHGTRLLEPASALLHGTRLEQRINRIFSAAKRSKQAGLLVRAAVITLFVPGVYLAAAARPGAPQSPARLAVLDDDSTTADLEARLAAKPDDVDLHRQLLIRYWNDRQGSKYVPQLLWVIEHDPEDAWLGAMGLRPEGSAFNTPDDYVRIEQAWEAALAGHPDSPKVLMNAAAFFEPGDPARALELLRQAKQLAPEDTHNRYQYAMASIYVEAFVSAIPHSLTKSHMTPDLAAQLRNELDSSTDTSLLSTVGTHLVQIGTHSYPELKAKGFDLLQRAIDLDPANPALKEALESAKAEPVRQANYANAMHPAGAIRIGAAVAAANLENKVDPVYPPLALSAQIRGTVEFSIVIGADGRVQDIRLVRGHPLLVNAAKEAVAQYRYRPTLLNGKAVPVATDVNVLFELPK
ncbi:MAG TPA: TonB family protein [Bryobacteraceae bacterium]|jgi:TonB family protein|nr:TonB family protein [Bryobacteraceae bacterium]